MCSDFKMNGIFVYFQFDLTPCECSTRFDWGLSTRHRGLWILIAFCVNFRRSFFDFLRCLVDWDGVALGAKWNRKPSPSIIWNDCNSFLRRCFNSTGKNSRFSVTKMALAFICHFNVTLVLPANSRIARCTRFSRECNIRMTITNNNSK